MGLFVAAVPSLIAAKLGASVFPKRSVDVIVGEELLDGFELEVEDEVCCSPVDPTDADVDVDVPVDVDAIAATEVDVEIKAGAWNKPKGFSHGIGS